MTGMDDRREGMAGKLAHDDQLEFKIEARASKLFGLKIAEEIGLSDEEALAYAMTVVSANLEEPGFEDIYRKVRPDLEAKGAEHTQHWLDVTMGACMKEARTQICAGE